MKIDWFRKEFKDKYHSLCKLYLKETDDIKRKEILETINILKICLTKDKYIDDINTIIENDYLYLTETPFIWPYIIKMANIDVKYIDKDMDKDIKFSNKKLIELLNIFFKNGTNKEIYDAFNKIYKDNKKNIHIIDAKKDFYAGETIYLDYYKKYYIQVFKSNTFDDLTTLAHEFGHAIQCYKNYHISAFGQLNVYIELISVFFELLCNEYFTKGKLKDIAINTSYDNLLINLDCASILKYEFMLLNEIKIDKHENKFKLRDNIDDLVSEFSQDEIDNYINLNPSGQYIYTFAYLVASNLLMIYRKDPDLAFYLVNRIINLFGNRSCESYLHELKKLDLVDTTKTKEYSELVYKRCRNLK